MNSIEPILSDGGCLSVCIKLAISLLHFLWQGCLIALVAGWAAHGFRQRSANARYFVYVAAMGAMTLCLPTTFVLVSIGDIPTLGTDGMHMTTSRIVTTTAATPVPADAFSDRDSTAADRFPTTDKSTLDGAEVTAVRRDGESSTETAERAVRTNSTSGRRRALLWTPYIAAFYLLGVVVMLLRVVRDLWGAERLRREAMAMDQPHLLETVRIQAHRIGLKVVPAIRLSQRVVVPAIIGVLRPMILLPSAAITGLSTGELEALIVHELAHVRRYDLLVSLWQRLAEAILFFHPAVWWVSWRIDVERELCCDDLVLSSGVPRIRYADALVRMAELCLAARHAHQAALLIGAGSRGTHLKHRVLRILRTTQTGAPQLRLSRSGVVCLMAAWAAVMFAPLLFDGRSSAERALPAQEAELPQTDHQGLLALAKRLDMMAPTNDMVVTLEPIFGTITGRGRPVAGAKVYLREYSQITDGWGRNEPTETRDLADTESSAQGTFRFERVTLQLNNRRENVFPLDVIVVADGYAVAWRHLTACGACNFQLQPESTIFGHVMDDQKQPASGTSVRVLRFLPLTEIANMNLEGRRYPRSVGNMLDLAYAGFRMSADVDGQGNFVLRGLPKNSGVVLELSDPRFYREVIYTTSNPDHPTWRQSSNLSNPARSTYVVPSPYERSLAIADNVPRRATFALRESVQVSPIHVTLQRAIQLRVRFVHDNTGSPIAGAFVPAAPTFTLPGKGRTDENGVYTYSQLEPGLLSLVVVPPENSACASTTAQIELADNEYDASAEVRLPRGAAISGRVVDQMTGLGIAGVELRYFAAANVGSSSSATTDSEGYLHIAGHPGDGQVIIYSRVPGYMTPWRVRSLDQVPSQFRRVVHPTLDAPSTGIEFQLIREVVFHGRTVDPAGNPIDGVQITSSIPADRNSYFPVKLRSHTDGRYVLTGLFSDAMWKRKSEIPVFFRAESQGLAARVVFAPPHSDAKTEIESDIQLQRVGSVAGRVIDNRSNEPIVGAHVHVYESYGDAGRHIGDTKTDSRGHYVYQGLIPQQEYTLSAGSDGYHAAGDGQVQAHTDVFVVRSGATMAMSDLHLQRDTAFKALEASIPKIEPPSLEGLTPEMALERLVAQFKDDHTVYRERVSVARNSNERSVIVARLEPTVAYSVAMETLARAHAETDVELTALVWICNASVYAGADAEGLVRRQAWAAKRLLENYSNRKEIIDCLETLVYRSGNPLTTAESFIDKSPYREIRARACLLAAEVCERDLAIASQVGQTPPELSRQAAIRYYRRTMAEFADVPYFHYGTMGNRASRALHELEHLWIGQVAPEITGEDLDGNSWQLSDYRGKIVLLLFATRSEELSKWSRSLAEWADGITAIVVYSGSDREAVRVAIAESKLPWRLWFDGSAQQPITSAWNITSFPTAYVLDHQGIIRYRDLNQSELATAIEELWPPASGGSR